MKWNKEEWEKVELANVSKDNVFVDGDWVESKDQDANGGVRLLQLADVGDAVFVNKSNRFMNKETAERLNCTYLKENDILIARMPDPIGRACLFPFSENEKYVTVVDVAVLRVNELNDCKYIMYAINSPTFRNDVLSNISGTTRQRITRKKLGKFQIPLPPLQTQKEIADLLDTADALRQKTQAQIDALDELARSVFLDMFGDPVKNEKGWEVRKFDYFANLDTKMISNFKGYENYPHIGIANIEKETGRLHSFKSIAEDGVVSGKYLFSKNHIIYSKIRPNLNKVALPDFDGLCSADSYPILVNKENANKLFFAYLLRSDDFVDFILGHSVRTNIPKANKKQMLMYEGICPPVVLQNQFASIIENIEAQKVKLKESLKESEDLFGCLMQEVFG